MNTIVRVPQRERPVVVSREVADDPRLTFGGKGLLVHLLARPDDWEVTPGELARTNGTTEYAVGQLLKELKGAGYAALINPRAEGGRLQGRRWLVYESPAANPYHRAAAGVFHAEPADFVVSVATEAPDSRRSEKPDVGDSDPLLTTTTGSKAVRGKPNTRAVAAAPREAITEAVGQLVARGVDLHVAGRLVREHAENVAGALARFDQEVAAGKPRAAGWLVAAVRGGWKPAAPAAVQPPPAPRAPDAPPRKRPAGPSAADVQLATGAAIERLPPALRKRAEDLGEFWPTDPEVNEAVHALVPVVLRERANSGAP
jgi:hypothetical protein